jgi:hypothetical protein
MGYTDKLTFLNQYKSYAQLARDYDIPYRTLLYMKNTDETVSAYTSNMSRLWSNESYASMKAENVPTVERSALRGGALSKVTSAITTTNALLDKWATGATMLKYDARGINATGKERDSFYTTTRQQIAASLEKNKTTVEALYGETDKTRY